MEFHPVVVESTGAFGDSANQVLDILSSHASPADSLPVSIWKSLLARSIAISLQRGNAHILSQGFKLSNSHAHHQLVGRQ